MAYVDLNLEVVYDHDRDHDHEWSSTLSGVVLKFSLMIVMKCCKSGLATCCPALSVVADVHGNLFQVMLKFMYIPLQSRTYNT